MFGFGDVVGFAGWGVVGGSRSEADERWSRSSGVWLRGGFGR